MNNYELGQLVHELHIAIHEAKEKGYTLVSHTTLLTREKKCCPVGALIIHRGLQDRFNPTFSSLHMEELLNIPSIGDFTWGFDYPNNLEEHRPLMSIGRNFHLIYTPE